MKEDNKKFVLIGLIISVVSLVILLVVLLSKKQNNYISVKAEFKEPEHKEEPTPCEAKPVENKPDLKEKVETILRNCNPEKISTVLLPVMTVMSTNANTILNFLRK